MVKIVDHYVAPGGYGGYSIDVFNALCHTLAIAVTIAFELLRMDELLCRWAPVVGL